MHRQIPAADAAVNQFICDVCTVLEEALAEDGLAEQAERFAGSARFAMARERLEAAIEAMRAPIADVRERERVERAQNVPR